VGGSFRFNTSNHKTDDTPTDKTSNYSLYLTPSAGKFLSEKFAIGIELDLSLSRNKTDFLTETISKSSSFGGSPFLRFYAIKWNKLSLYGQGNIGLEFSRSRINSGGTTINGPKSTTTYVNIYPGISYDISDKLSLQTSLNILSLGYNYSITKGDSSKTTASSFNIGAGLGNIISFNAITIGGIYKF